MSSEPVIAATGLGKRYEIYATPRDRLRQLVVPRLRRGLGLAPRDYFREFWALRGVSLSIGRGETVGIIGQNGSGKSTLLQLLCGTLTPTEGTRSARGRISALLELGAGFNPEFSGRENIRLSGLVYGISDERLSEQMEAIVAFADIGDFIDQPVKTYSSGMAVRLAFAIAAHVDAETMVIDEALAVGDVRFTQKCMRFLRRFQETGTLLFVSHDAASVVNLCGRAIWLDAGRVCADGPAREVVELYLAEQHARDRAEAGEKVAVRRTAAPASAWRPRPEQTADVRGERLAASSRTARVQVFEFERPDESVGFGTGGARIVDVRLTTPAGEPVALLEGGELVRLEIVAEALADLDGVIVGWYLKDRLGQQLFGDNTFLSYADDPLRAAPGTSVTATFDFRMPLLSSGEFSVDVALATGTQLEHTQQCWVHDALGLRVSNNSIHGLVGVPMTDIRLRAEAPETTR
ncbi:MAG: hypothetical protein RJA99_3413 [Pseudomonadota bacterium]|jgi:lipopolysaccharide transport system ATP-binding protein